MSIYWRTIELIIKCSGLKMKDNKICVEIIYSWKKNLKFYFLSLHIKLIITILCVLCSDYSLPILIIKKLLNSFMEIFVNIKPYLHKILLFLKLL